MLNHLISPIFPNQGSKLHQSIYIILAFVWCINHTFWANTCFQKIISVFLNGTFWDFFQKVIIEIGLPSKNKRKAKAESGYVPGYCLDWREKRITTNVPLTTVSYFMFGPSILHCNASFRILSSIELF